ncbi:hypothetical protein JW935_17930 [candidate division KSB1 bacterium]|nr:hypothetical protein [candidate division KSB1 bacterium]
MIEKDYIMRMIQQLVMVLARVLFFKQMNNYDKALEEIDDAFRNLLKVEPGSIAFLPTDDIISLLSERGEQCWEQCIVMAELLREEGEIYELKNSQFESVPFIFIKSLRLFIEAAWNDFTFRTREYFDKMMGLVDRIPLDLVDMDLKYDLYRFYTMTGETDRIIDLYRELKKANYAKLDNP